MYDATPYSEYKAQGYGGTYFVSEHRLEVQRSGVEPPQGTPARNSETTYN